jgi:hypothetical protein
MRLLVKTSLLLTITIFSTLGVILWNTVPQLQFDSRGLDWRWDWYYFEPFSNGIQATRTNDTKQLLQRRVYLKESLVIYVSTTIDNHYEVDVVYGKPCKIGSPGKIEILINEQGIDESAMNCEQSQQSTIARKVVPKLKNLTIKISDKYIKENFELWPLSELRSDQFKQRHSQFFNSVEKSENHQWLRD